MTQFSLVENEFLAEARGEPLGSIFHSARFFRLHAGMDGRFFEWTDGQRVLATVHYTPIDEGHWRSPAQGTFAGYAMAKGAVMQDLLDFHQAVEERLLQLGARSLEVLPPPMAHDPVAFSEQVYVLSSHGFTVARTDLNQSLQVGSQPMRLSNFNRQRLKKLQAGGYACAQLPPEALHDVYRITSANRTAKGYFVSMSVQQLQQMQAEFPENFLLFGCHLEGELVAAGIFLRLDASTVYLFDWASLPDHVQNSPVVMIATTVHAYCKAHGISLFDAGTSTIDAVPNMGLLQFKSRLGLETSLKVRLEKKC